MHDSRKAYFERVVDHPSHVAKIDALLSRYPDAATLSHKLAHKYHAPVPAVVYVAPDGTAALYPPTEDIAQSVLQPGDPSTPRRAPAPTRMAAVATPLVGFIYDLCTVTFDANPQLTI